ncbi:hypothetical protein ACLB2K_046123 [Fragaria x ananassa]
MIEGMRADSARLERERARDHEEAMARERRLERHNATLMNTLAQRIDQNQAIDRAIMAQQAQGTGNQETPVNPVKLVTPATRARRTVHVGVNLLSEGMQNEGPPLQPLYALGIAQEGAADMEAVQRAMRDNMVSLTTRVDDAERITIPTFSSIASIPTRMSSVTRTRHVATCFKKRWSKKH